MIALVEQHRQQIADICRKHQVRKLELFGSAARGDFDPQTSDIDFLVEFRCYDSLAIADQWFGLQEDLTALLGCGIDLTSLRTAKNPYFLETTNRDKVGLFDAA